MPPESYAVLQEPYTTALLLAGLGVLVAASVLFSRPAQRLGVPVVLLFLVLGMLGGSEGLGGIAFDDYGLAVRLGTVALVLILFDGGLATAVSSIRSVAAPAGLLATAGVVLTALLVALFARLVGLGWTEAMLLGAVVSSTDAAAVFAVLRGGSLHLRPRVARTIEVESCANDPMAVILTMTAIEIVASDKALGWGMLMSVPVQLLVGGAVGLAVGYLGRVLLRRVTLPTVGLLPALTISIAFVAYGAATVAGGSGFLSVYVAAVVVGNSQGIPYRSGLCRVHDAVAWLSQIGMFLMLGLLVMPSRLLDVLWVGLGVGLFLAVVARPLAVWACLWPFKFDWRETAYIGTAGLRGAVPIVLATMPLLAGVPGAERLFDVVFFVVVLTSVVPGTFLRPLTRYLGVGVNQRPAPQAVLEINAPRMSGGELLSFYIEPSLAVCGAKLRELEFPAGSAIVMVVRGRQFVAAKGNTQLREGDHAYVFMRPEDRPLIELLFGSAEV